VRRWWLPVSVVAFALAVVATVDWVHHVNDFFPVDLDVYTWGGETVRAGGDLYDDRYAGFLLFTYTPFAAATFVPLSLVSFDVLKVAVLSIGIAAVVASVWVSLGSLGHARDVTRVSLTFGLGAVSLFFEPVRETLTFGQVNLVLMLIVLADLCLPDTSRWKGIGIGIATGFKLTPAIFIVYLLVTRRWTGAIRSVVAAAATVAIGFVVLPAESAQFWFDRVFLDSARVGGVPFVANQSINATLFRALGDQASARPFWLLAVVVVAPMGLACAAWLSRRGHELAGIVTCATVGLLVSPVSWSHHWVWVVPALVLGVDTAWRHRALVWPWVLVGLGAAAFLVRPEPGWIWQVPNRGDQELDWTFPETIIGNLYVLVALAALVTVAVSLSALVARTPRPRNWRRSARIAREAPPISAESRRLGLSVHHSQNSTAKPTRPATNHRFAQVC
jgi:alpha-1,2-mannosyltransferase